MQHKINWIMKWIMSEKIRTLNDLIDELYFSKYRIIDRLLNPLKTKC